MSQKSGGSESSRGKPSRKKEKLAGKRLLGLDLFEHAREYKPAPELERETKNAKRNMINMKGAIKNHDNK